MTYYCMYKSFHSCVLWYIARYVSNMLQDEKVGNQDLQMCQLYSFQWCAQCMHIKILQEEKKISDLNLPVH